MAEGGEKKNINPNSLQGYEEKYYIIVKDLDDRIKRVAEEKLVVKAIDEEITETIRHVNELKGKKWFLEKKIHDQEELMEFWKGEIQFMSKVLWGRSRPPTPNIDNKHSKSE